MESVVLKEISKQFEPFRAFALIAGAIIGVLLAPLLNIFNGEIIVAAAAGVVLCQVAGMIIVEMLETYTIINTTLKTKPTKTNMAERT